MIDLSFIAEAVGNIAMAYVIVRSIPTLTAFVLLMTGTLDKEDLKAYKEFNKYERDKKKW